MRPEDASADNSESVKRSIQQVVIIRRPENCACNSPAAHIRRVPMPPPKFQTLFSTRRLAASVTSGTLSL